MYEEERKNLIAQAEKLIAEHKIDEANAVMKQIEELDARHKEAAEARVNLDAMRNELKPITFQALSSGAVMGSTVAAVALAPQGAERSADYRDSDEYRREFMAFVTRGAGAVSDNFKNANEVTKTGDVGAVIPTTIINRIVEKMEKIGTIWNKVTKTSYQGGVSIPTSTAKPVATWVAESGTSDTQKKAVGNITFGYYKLICKVSVSLEVSVVTLDIFEQRIADNIAKAMTKSLELAILSGTGTGQPKGILKETTESGQAVTIAAADKLDFKVLTEAEAALPQAYENGTVWVMTKPTFIKHIVGMVDANKRPILREVIGTNGKPQYYILGREVALVDNGYMESYADTVSEDSVIAFLFNFSDYIMNVNYDITMREYIDEDTDDRIKKAIMLADGKVADKGSLVTVTKKKATS